MEFMGIKPNIRKAAELGICVTGILLLLTGCPGGGSSSAPSGGTTSAYVVPFGGMFKSGQVSLKDATGTNVNIGNTGVIGLNASGVAASGVAYVTYPNTGYVYPLTTSVSGVFYNDATGNATESTGASPMLGFIANSTAANASVASAATGIPVNAITNAAVALVKLQPTLTPASAVQIVASNLGLGSTYTNTAPVFNPTTGLANDQSTLALAGLNILASATPGGMAAALQTLSNNIASAVNAGQSLSSIVSTASLNTAMTSAHTTASANATSAGATQPPAAPTVTVPASSVAPTTVNAIQQAKMLLTNLNTAFIKQASGIQADLNSIASPVQEIQNFEYVLSQAMNLASNGTLNQTLSVCTLTNLSGSNTSGAPGSKNGTAVCQWTASSATHTLTVIGPNDMPTQTLAGTYTWTDTIGSSSATGQVILATNSATLNGNILPGAGVTASHTLTNINNLVVTESGTTISLIGTVAEKNGNATVDSVIFQSGSQIGLTSGGVITSAALNMQASTPNYGFNGTLALSNFTTSNSVMFPAKMVFTGSVANASGTTTYLNTTGTNGGLTVNSSWTGYNPAVAISSSNYPTESGTFVGNIIGTETDSVNLTFTNSGMGAGFGSDDIQTVTVGNSSGSVVAGSDIVKYSGTQIGTISGGSGNVTFTFTDSSTLSF